MSSIEIKKVESRYDLKKFIEFHYDLYEGNPYDVPNLYSDDVNTLRKDKNAAFDFCEAEYYMAFKDGRMVGRVAAIINHRANEKWKQKRVRFGWIDFIDDLEVSGALLKAVEDYGRKKGMTEVVGPLGFTDLDPEGMLTWGFDQLGTMPTISTTNIIRNTWRLSEASRWTTNMWNTNCMCPTPCLRNMSR